MTQWEEEGGKEVTVGRRTDGRLLGVAVALRGGAHKRVAVKGGAVKGDDIGKEDVVDKELITSVDVSDTTNLLELCQDKPAGSSPPAGCKAVYIVQDQGKFVQVIDCGPDKVAVCSDITVSVNKCLEELGGGRTSSASQGSHAITCAFKLLLHWMYVAIEQALGAHVMHGKIPLF